MSYFECGQLEVRNCKFTWITDNIKEECNKILIQSPLFKIENFDKFQWTVELHFGEKQSSEGFLSLFLKNESNEDVQIYFELSLSNMSGVVIEKRSANQKFCSTRSWGWFKFCNLDKVLQKTNSSLVDNRLIITCTIYMDVWHEEMIKETILDDYESLFQDKNLSDLTIRIENKNIKAHKSILSARSKVFAAMFNHDMKENNTNIIEIIDISYDIMEELLLFIYCGKVHNLKKNAKFLLPAAEKYEIKKLKALCEESLWTNMKIENVCENLGMAHLYNCTAMQIKIIDYIITNIKQIYNKPQFIELNRSNPELFEKIITELVEKKL